MYHWCWISRGVAEYVFMGCETYESAGPLSFELGSERLTATKWFCDSLLSYPTKLIVSTAARPESA